MACNRFPHTEQITKSLSINTSWNWFTGSWTNSMFTHTLFINILDGDIYNRFTRVDTVCIKRQRRSDVCSLPQIVCTLLSSLSMKVAAPRSIMFTYGKSFLYFVALQDMPTSGFQHSPAVNKNEWPLVTLSSWISVCVSVAWAYYQS